MRIGIGTKALVGFLLVVVVTAAPGLYALYALQETVGRYEQLTGEMMQVPGTLRALFGAMQQQSSALRAYLIKADEGYLQEAQAAATQAAGYVAALEGMELTPEERQVLEGLKDQVLHFAIIMRSVEGLARTAGGETAQILLRRGEGVMAQFNQDAGRLQALVDGRIDAARTQNLDHARRVTAGAQAAALGAALLALGLAALGVRTVVRPLWAIARGARAVAGGDLAVLPPAVRSRDEVGDLAAAFRGLVTGLRDSAMGLQAGARELVQRSRELAGAAAGTQEATDAIGGLVAGAAAHAGEQAATVAESAAAMEQLRQAAEQMAAGAREQAARAAQARGALGRTVAEVRAVAGTAAEASASAGHTLASARSGVAAVAESVAWMERIHGLLGDHAGAMAELSRVSDAITAATTQIGALAEQINLLALNAAIEAARAGEHGRGFAVVAAEVRKLAEGSRRTSQEIAGLVEAIRNGTRQAVATSAEVATAAETGAGKAASARQALDEILDDMARMTEGLQSIATAAAAVEGQVATVEEAVVRVSGISEEHATAIAQMAGVTGQVSAAIQRIRAVAAEHQTGMEHISRRVEQVGANTRAVVAAAEASRDLAVHLEALGRRFRLGASPDGAAFTAS